MVERIKICITMITINQGYWISTHTCSGDVRVHSVDNER